MRFTDTIRFDIAYMSAIFAIGNIYFGHFEEHTPKWRRLAKYIIMTCIATTLSYYGGRIFVYILLALLGGIFIYIHAILLPRKGINGRTAEPKEKYYAFRGRKKKMP